MNTQQAQIQIDKINALWRSMNATPGQISSIERDLMRSYILNLYEAFTLEAVVPAQTSIPASPTPTIYEPPMAKPTVIAPPPVESKPVNEPLPPKVIPPPPPKPDNPPVSVPGISVKTAPIEQRFDSLFKASASGDLSDKLSRQPIAQLNKAFAINDKVLYINDLFEKDHLVFSDTIRVLDNLQHMDEAKRIIADLADQYQWLDETRLETAQAFVQLVQRRFLK
jgi:hypothetical protein